MGETSNSQALLQMLMPIVRPDGIAPSSNSQNLPLEQQSFEQMLEGLSSQQQMTTGDGTEIPDGEDELQASQMLSKLGGINRIENSTLRDMLTRNTQQSDSSMQRD
ncbi:MAG TPA: hypothetical protein DCM28_10460 [Phycisphaerales bacterium]|nr:hypothetical protein [Phycisphaerales bacterium]HCD33516.1 hypothetical protein [Phycisphaerales bacterium]|tara:strand:+ start:2253 stop:2570 length:318 start_codon:yes stop_codon:yes gene_type:complete